MSDNWQETLRKLHEQLLKDKGSNSAALSAKDKAKAATPSVGSRPAATAQMRAVEAVLGIDFGTRFTKVALSLPHIDRRILLTVQGAERVVPSRLILGDDDRLYSITCGSQAKPKVPIEYLKNRLADPHAGAFGGYVAVGKYQLNQIIRPACAFYLADILRRAEAAARAAFPAELSSARSVNWSANVGVPTKHFDSEMLGIFREVAAVAWVWRTKPAGSISPADLAADYEKAAASINPKEMPIQVAPELTAALVHFAEHRNTPAGAYSFFDIGGGTLDGSVFRLRRDNDGSSFDILAANVEELGTMAITRNLVAHAYKSMATLVEHPIILGGVSPQISIAIPRQIEERIQTFFSTVIVGAVQRGLFPPSAQPSRRGLNEAPKPTLPVFVGGGGCRSEWYQRLFVRTCEEYSHSSQWGIAGYDVKIVPPPAGIVNDDYPRFVIALGLTSPNLHFNQYRLPSRYSPVPNLPDRKLSVPAYGDTKDLT
ncbi:hypothetical protein [Bradyrhizobium sp. Mp27]|uniref:hypothetical protein n=1 Tax=Bradyrhizobium sp. Mp27 TaxID=3042157 RepID=UPI00248B0C62|nr:hypothetical protein [Bradyrhizobium sp. Mp27]MDI2073064.1 hypothetical protein [Bradyrhizobium sp. Mp27]